MTTTSDTQQRAALAADESRHVGHVAAQEAGNVAQEGLHQARHLADEAKGQLTEQSRAQRDRLVDTMKAFSGDLDRMASGQAPTSGLATDLVRQAADRTRDLTDRLEGREPAQILDDVRGFARRRPGLFLLGSLAAGVVAGRLLRGAKDGSTTSGPGVTGTQVTPAYDTGTAVPPYDQTLTTPATTAVPTTGATTGTTGTATGEWTAPQPVTGPLGVDAPGQGAYRDSATGSL